MNIALRTAGMTRDQFLDWAGAQNEHYEFDGYEPVLMTGGTGNHSLINHNLYFTLQSRLRGSGWRMLGPDVGLATVGNTVRYPDALVTRTAFKGTARLIPGAAVVFEVISPTSGQTDRIVKVREYQAVGTILRYLIVECGSAGVTVLSRTDGAADWTSKTLVAGEVLPLPELGIEFPVSDPYIDLPADGEAASAIS